MSEFRSPSLNSKFHSMLGVIAKQLTHHGQHLDAEDWKRLTIQAFRFETKDDPEFRDEWRKFGEMRLLPALNNNGFVAVGEQSRKFSNKLASGYVEWLYAFGTEQGVRFPAPERYREEVAA